MKKGLFVFFAVALGVWYFATKSGPPVTETEIVETHSRSVERPTETRPVEGTVEAKTESSSDNGPAPQSPSAQPESPETQDLPPETVAQKPEPVFLELPLNQMSGFLKKTTKLEEISGEGFFVPGCYLGEHRPYVGKPERFEIKLGYAARGGYSGHDPSWKIYPSSNLTILLLGEVYRSYGPDSFRKAPPAEKGSFGFLIVDGEKAVYQFFGEKGQIRMKYFENRGGNWEQLSETMLSLSRNHLDCATFTPAED